MSQVHQCDIESLIYWFSETRYEELLTRLPAVADMFKTRFCYLFPAGAKSLIETSREFVIAFLMILFINNNLVGVASLPLMITWMDIQKHIHFQIVSP